MSNAQHTPGPWRVYERPYEGVDFVVEFGPGDWGGFSVSNHGGIDRRTGEWTAPMADARLIAAAPDLLAELERLIEECDFPYAMLRRARAAIAKANGAQP